MRSQFLSPPSINHKKRKSAPSQNPGRFGNLKEPETGPYFFLDFTCERALPAAAFAALLEVVDFNTLDAAFAAFLPVPLSAIAVTSNPYLFGSTNLYLLSEPTDMLKIHPQMAQLETTAIAIAPCAPANRLTMAPMNIPAMTNRPVRVLPMSQP